VQIERTEWQRLAAGSAAEGPADVLGL